MSTAILPGRLARRALLTALAALLCLVAASGAARAAEFGPAGFDGSIAADQGEETSFTQAAGHPYSYATTIKFNLDPASKENDDPTDFPETLWPAEPVRDTVVNVPPGFLGKPAGIPQCQLSELVGTSTNHFERECPSDAQIGVVTLRASACPEGCIELPFAETFHDQPIFNMVSPPGSAARFAFDIGGEVVTLDPQVRATGSGYRLAVSVRDISEALPILSTTLTLWGVPAAESHTPQRWCPGEGYSGKRCPAGVPPTAFLRMPTSCAAADTWGLHMDSWFHPAPLLPDGTPDLGDPRWKSTSYENHQLAADPSPGAPVGESGCDQVPFEPQIALAPTTDRADSPTGLSVNLSVPQDELSEPASIAQSDLRKAVVTLPQGMSVNPSQAAGLGTCGSAQIGLGSNAPPSCPDAAKIGTARIETPLIEEPLPGAVYLAAQGDNPFHSLLALYIVIDDPATGVILKLPGEVKLAPDGRLTTVFDDNPQLPFSNLHLQLKGGPQGVLINPPTCGPHTTTATLTPWSGNAPVDLSSTFNLTEGPNGAPCPTTPAPFNPKLSAGSASPIAAAFTPFNLRLTREDGTQQFTSLSATLPPGLIGKLAGIPYCPDSALAAVSGTEGTAAAQIASPSCPAASQLGTVTAGAGAGPSPFFLSTGKAYLAGPYKSAPLSLAIVTPALAGPFDLGSVLVRVALQVNPDTAQITAVSNPIPTLLHGIPLDLRDLRVNIDRPGFTLNPTNCDPLSVGGSATGSEGATAPLSDHFQVGECGRLPFKPKLKLSLKGGTRRTAHPSLKAVLTAKPGEANIAKAQVKLPPSAFLDNAHIGAVCTRPAFATHTCPPNSVYGTATAITPLLDQPLSGKVYLRSSTHKLPDLVADLNGQIEVTLAGKTDSVKGALRNTFEAVPDAPVTKFSLTLFGGKRGLIEMSSGFCKAPRASIELDGQNGKVHDTEPVVGSSCAKSRKAHEHRGKK